MGGIWNWGLGGICLAKGHSFHGVGFLTRRERPNHGSTVASQLSFPSYVGLLRNAGGEKLTKRCFQGVVFRGGSCDQALLSNVYQRDSAP